MDPSRRQGRRSACIVVMLVCIALMVDSSTAVEVVKVGGSTGWTLGYNYTTWASTVRVRLCDSLLFKYNAKFHDVLLVSKAEFDACQATAPWARYTTGKDYIKFRSPGTYYLICSVGHHCAAGMKVAVTVKW